MPRGRPAFEITDKVISQVEALAAQGLNREQIAWSLGIHPGTLYKKKAENEELNEAIKRGEAKGLATITNALFQNAKKGNVTAQIYYTKCRAPNEWNDRAHESPEDKPPPQRVEIVMVDGRANAEKPKD